MQGSICSGFDCVNGESFGSDTIRLKENNLRIHFDDTSVSTGFPANDWRIVVNDQASGGTNHFSIEDSTGAKTPFRIEAGARTNSLVVNDAGRIGFGTQTPVLDLHVNTTNTPAHRLEQNNSGGFTAQTWDIAGNETNFFVRDVTGGSLLPFRIRPGAPSSSLDIAPSGNVGIGTASPSEKVHVSNSGVTNALVESTGSTASVIIKGAGNASFQIQSTALATANWQFETQSANAGFYLRQVGVGVIPFRVYAGAPSNSLTIASTGNVGLGVPSPAANLHVAGSIRFAGLASCTNGINTNASGVLSCAPAPSPARASLGTMASLGGAGSSVSKAARTSSSGGADRSAADGAQDAPTCGAATVSGRWSLMGTNVEAFGAGSMLWCDAGLQGSPTDAGKFDVSGTCRSHSPGSTTALSSRLEGTLTIADPSDCKLAGDLVIEQSNGVSVAATIVEGRLETASGASFTRGVAIARTKRGTSVALQSLMLQR